MRLLRRVLVVGLVATVLLCAGGVAVAGWWWNRMAISTVGEVAFTNPLPVPPLAPSRVDADGRRVFELVATTGEHDFGNGNGPVPAWGFNGGHLGPTLRAARGEQVAVEVSNRLPDETSVHWHGMHLPARMDGGPHQPVPPDTSWTPTWRVDQPAATLWYHPHPHGATERHVYRGLAGMFIVDDDVAGRLDLPGRYGVDDIPVIVQDKAFTGGGDLDERRSVFGAAGLLGDTIVVNGSVGPYLDVTTERVRLRLLNGATARVLNFEFADGRAFDLVGTDGGLLAAPHRTAQVVLSPGERAEVVVAMRPGEELVLRSTPPPLGAGFVGRLYGGADAFDVLQLRAADRLAASPRVPQRLVEVPRLDPADAVATREFRLSGVAINGERMDPRRIDAAVTRDTVEIWQVTSGDGQPHSFHIHDVQFQVLAVDGAAPPPHLRGWQDTIYLTPGVRFDLAIPFGGDVDPDVPYLFHCHLLAHEDAGMMGQFVVVEPGQQPGTPPDSHGHVSSHGHGHGDGDGDGWSSPG